MYKRQTRNKIKKHFPPTVPIHNGNPADVGGGATASDYNFVLEQFLADKNIDIAMPWFVFQDDPLEETIVDYLAALSKKKKKPILCGGNGGPYTEKMIKLIEKHNVPVYQDLRTWVVEVDSLAERMEIQSCGRSLEIIKDTGSAAEVAEKHNVREMVGTHGLGHARLATESSVLPNASHPFWARPFSDMAIVHNGQITDYYTWRDKLQRKGYRFLTENDSELIAIWVSDQMIACMTMEQALKKSIKKIIKLRLKNSNI